MIKRLSIHTAAWSLLMAASTSGQSTQRVSLPEPCLDGDVTVERTLAERRSVRAYDDALLDLDEVSQLLWAAQGVTEPRPDAPEGWRWGPWAGGLRTAPSAGALYPLELYLVAGRVEGLDPGVYRYVPLDHALVRTRDGDRGRALADAALSQRQVAEAPAVVVFAAEYARAAIKYGERAERYVHIEVGAAAENTMLQAVALGLATVPVGAFRDAAVKEALGLPAEHEPLLIVPVGRPAG